MEQVEQIKESIEKFGFNDPIAVSGENNIIVEGHGRYEAAKDMGLEEVPVIHLDELTDEQRKAYGLVHNKLTLNSWFDYDNLQKELDELENTEINMADFGFYSDENQEDTDFEEILELSDSDDNKSPEALYECPKCHYTGKKGSFKKADKIGID